MDTPNPATPPEDSRPGAATLLTVSAADLAALIGDQAAASAFAHSALKALKMQIDDAMESPPAPDELRAFLRAVSDVLDAPGILTTRAAAGLRELEKAICAAAEKHEGKPMPHPGKSMLKDLSDAMPEKATPGALGAALIKYLEKRTLSLTLTASARPTPPPYSGRNGGAWPQSPWNN